MALEERLELSIDDALRGIDKIEEALGSSAISFKVALAEALDLLSSIKVDDFDASAITTSIDQAVADANTSPEIDAAVNVDAEAVTSALDEAVASADISVDLEADASALTSSIDDAVSSADTQVDVQAVTDQMTADIESAVQGADATVDVEANTQQAEDKVTALADAASSSSGALGGNAQALGAVGDASRLAAGDLGAIAATLGSITGKSSVATGAVIGVAGGLGLLVDKALASDTATRRFEAVLGEFASQIDSIHIDGFANSLTQLAERAGQNDDALRLAAASIFELGKSSGSAGPQVANTTEQILLLATHLATSNPLLGEAGPLAEQLTGALARGGRTAAAFGLSLNANEIELRAMRDTGKATAQELTVYERAAAGAAIVTERLGSSLQSGIVEGAQTPAIQLRALRQELENALEAFAQPLLQPLIDAARNGEPILEDLGRILGELGATVLPVVADLLQTIAPFMETAANSAHLFLTAVKPLLGVLDQVGKVTGGTSFGPFNAQVGESKDKFFSWGTAIQAVRNPLGLVQQGLGALAGHFAGSAKAADDAGSSAEALAAHERAAAAATADAASASAAAAGGLASITLAYNAAAAAATAYANRSNMIIGPTLEAHGAELQLLDLTGQLEKNLRNEGGAAGGAADNHRALASAQKGVRDAERGVIDAQEALNRLQTEEIPKRLADMEQKLADAVGAVDAAEVKLADTQKALNELQTKTIPEELAAANKAVAEAVKGLATADEQVLEAEQKLAEVRDVTIPRELERLTRAVTSGSKDLAAAQRSLTEAQERLNHVNDDYAESLQRAEIAQERAQFRQLDAIDRVKELERELAKLDRRRPTSDRGRTALAEQRAKIQRDLAEAQLDVRDAALAETDAQQKLEDVRGPDQQKKVADAQKAVADAQDHVTDSARQQAEAQQALNEFQTTGAQKELEQATKAVAQAKEREQQATETLSDRQKALNELQSTTIPRQLEQAERAIEEARHGVEDATRRESDAQKELSDAQRENGTFAREVGDAQQKIADAMERVTQAHESVAAAMEKSSGAAKENTATFDIHTEAGRRNLALLDSIVKSHETYIEKLIANGAASDVVAAAKAKEIAQLEDLQRRYPEIATLIQGYIDKLNAIPVPQPIKIVIDGIEPALENLEKIKKAFREAGEEAKNANRLAEQAIGFSTSGLQLQAGGPFEPGFALVGEQGPEMVAFRQPGFVLTAQQTQQAFVQAAAAHGGGNIDTEAFAAIIVREMQRVLLAQRPIIVNEVARDARATAQAVAARLGFESFR